MAMSVDMHGTRQSAVVSIASHAATESHRAFVYVSITGGDGNAVTMYFNDMEQVRELTSKLAQRCEWLGDEKNVTVAAPNSQQING